MCETGLLSAAGFYSCQVKFGEAIDRDDNEATVRDQSVREMAVFHDIEWDIDLKPRGMQEIIDRLTEDLRSIYRANVSLGRPIEQVLQPLARIGSPENEIDYRPDSLSIEIGPIQCYNLESEQPLNVGWIAIGITGYGYLYPWTLKDAVKRLENSPEIRRLMETCRSFWPVRPELPEPHIIEARKQFADLWPYDDFAKPWDWYWGIAESG
jgi:hypothetical protein